MIITKTGKRINNISNVISILCIESQDSPLLTRKEMNKSITILGFPKIGV